MVVGHNARIAWGLTTIYADAADLVLEQVDEDDSTYLWKGRRLVLRERTETLQVAGEAPAETLTVRPTRHGPLLSDVDDLTADAGSAAGPGTLPPDTVNIGRGPSAGPYAVALQWTALRPGRTMDTVLAIDRAGSWPQFRNAARLFAVPSQNLVYADVDGHIGYQAPGEIPVRSRGDGRWPLPGWDPRYRWTGMVSFEALPSVLDPAGFAVTALPSMRMVVPLDDLDAARWVVPGGQSGHVFDDTYLDQVDAWLAGETFAWPYSPGAVAAACEDTLVLVPAPED